MGLQRFSFREFGEAAESMAAGAKTFLPTGSKREGVPPPPPPPPVFSEEQVKAAEAEGYKKGFLEGIEDGKKQAESEQASVDRTLMKTAERFIESIGPLFEDYRSLRLQIQQDIPKISLAIAHKIADPALASNAQAIIEETAMRCCEAMITEPKMTFTVHTSLAPTLENKLKQLAGRLQAVSDITVVGNAEIPVADCKIEWKNGAMERRTEQLWQQVERAIEGMGVVAKRDAETKLNALQKTLPNDKPLEKE